MTVFTSNSQNILLKISPKSTVRLFTFIECTFSEMFDMSNGVPASGASPNGAPAITFRVQNRVGCVAVDAS